MKCRALSLLPLHSPESPWGHLGAGQDPARCKHTPRSSVPACPCPCTRGCTHCSRTGRSSERGSSKALLHQRRHAGLPHKSWHFGVWQHVCKEQKEERKPESCSKAAACLLRVQLQPCPPSPGAGAMLPAPRPPSVRPSRCPFSLLAASSGRTISSRLMVTALASVLKSMVPISAWPGRRCCRRCAQQPRVLPSLGTASALPPSAAPALPAAPSGLCQSRP